VSFQEGSNSLLADLNFHRDASGAADTDRTAQLGNHAAAASDFEKQARKISEVIFGR
jgi:hypothetical protein